MGTCCSIPPNKDLLPSPGFAISAGKIGGNVFTSKS